MSELLEILRRLGVQPDDLSRIEKQYENDIDGLTRYVLFVRAEMDDRHEYLD